ncbi:MAG: DUF2163 domain-containing protein [Chlorobiaceae bacterium]|nr:DUF2163 domain-containing protein [Chlorobiaceae bacterium]
MKSATPELVALLASSRQFACTDLFTIVRQNGDTLRYSSADVPVYWEENMFTCYGLQIYGLRYRLVTGLEADEQTLTIAGERTQTLVGMPFLDAIQSGVLDGARIKRERAYFDGWGVGVQDMLRPVGCLTVFSGFVSSVDAVTRTSADLRVKSNLALLDVTMPRNSWQASCIHTLFDSGCGLNKLAHSRNGSAEAGSTDVVVNWSGAAAAYYWNGTFAVTSGANAGLGRSIKNSNGTQLLLSYPLPNAMAEGDLFVVCPGCDHTAYTCETRFGNKSNYRGYPYIPTAEIAL